MMNSARRRVRSMHERATRVHHTPARSQARLGVQQDKRLHHLVQIEYSLDSNELEPVQARRLRASLELARRQAQLEPTPLCLICGRPPQFQYKHDFSQVGSLLEAT